MIGAATRAGPACVLAAGLAAVVAATCMVALLRQGDHHAARPAPPATDAARLLHVLARPPAPSDRLESTRAGANELRRPPLIAGEQRSRARRLALGGGASAYLWPAPDAVCYLAPVGSGCMPLARIARRGLDVAVLAQVSPASGRYLRARVLGIARDGIGAVVLALPHGRTTAVRVHDNGFFADGLRAPPTAVRWRDRAGVHTVPVRALSPREIAGLR